MRQEHVRPICIGWSAYNRASDREEKILHNRLCVNTVHLSKQTVHDSCEVLAEIRTVGINSYKIIVIYPADA